MPCAEVHVLGPVEVVDHDRVALSLASKQTRLLAALLVADGQVLEADELVEAVWSGSAPASSRNLVQVYVSLLRKALPSGIDVVTRGRGYAIELGAEVLDAARFGRLLGESVAARGDENPALALSLADQALGLWRGRAYGELAYEEFARAQSERLEELRLVAVEERLQAQLDLGRHTEVLGEVLAVAEENPYRERLHRQAMLAFYRAGRQKEALEHYASVREHLTLELGLEPGPDLRELQRRILLQDPSLVAEAAGERLAAGRSLPSAPNALVGRGRELDELGALLARREARFIVLTGAGGSGKTRLALEAARRAAHSYANGVEIVELAPLHDAALVISTIARTLGVAEDPDDRQLETVASALASRELLLLIDNAEHVREAAADFVRLLCEAPRLTLLVTSRAVLHVSGEHVFPVLPLAEDDAVELFVQRARLLDATFARTDENLADLREICRRVDRLPLGVELAAARVRTLPPHRLRERLDERLALSTGGPRDLPARQQTLRETIGWSVGLLGERERVIFARLAVFAAGATLDAAEQVCGADLDTLGVLVDDHLLHRHDVLGEPRFRMLETVRAYALELLGSERARFELALAEHFVQLIDDLRLSEGHEFEWRHAIERLDPDLDNIRVGLAAAAGSGDAALQLRFAGGMWRYWWVRGLAAEGLEWIEGALARSGGPATSARARALYGGAGLAWSRGDFDRARELARSALMVSIEAGSEWYELGAHTVLGSVASDEGDYTAARHHHQRSLEIKVGLGIEPVVERLNLGEVALKSGENHAAQALFEDVLESHRRDGNPAGMGFALLNLGLVHLRLQDHEAARRAFEDSIACFGEVGFRQQVAHGLQGLAACEASDSRFEEAARVLGRARRELDATGTPWDAFAPDTVASTEALARRALGNDAFEAASRDASSEVPP